MLVLFFFISAITFSQGQYILFVDGTVKEGKSKLIGSTVTVYEDGEKSGSILTNASGKFGFDLLMDHEYIIEFSKTGYVSKRISVNTIGVPDDEAEFGFEYGGWQIGLFKTIEGLDVSILEKPIGKIFYVQAYGGFDYDAKYTKSIRNELAQLQLDLENKLEEQKKAEEIYKSAIALADKALAVSNYLEAIVKYTIALEAKVADTYATGKLAEAELKAKEANAAQVVKAEKEDEFNDLLAGADAKFKAKDYEGAKVGYSAAIGIKPNEKLPKDQIKKIDDILDKISKEKRLAEDLEAKRLADEQAAEESRLKAEAEESRLAEESEAKRLADEQAAEEFRIKAETEEKQLAEDLEAKRLADEQAAEESRLKAEAEEKRLAEDLEAKRLADEQAAEESRIKAETEEKRLAEDLEAKRLADEQAAEESRTKAEAEEKRLAEDLEAKRLADEQTAEESRLKAESEEEILAEELEAKQLADEQAAEESLLAKESADKAELERLAKEVANQTAQSEQDRLLNEQKEAKEAQEEEERLAKSAAENAEANRLAKVAENKREADRLAAIKAAQEIARARSAEAEAEAEAERLARLDKISSEQFSLSEYRDVIDRADLHYNFKKYEAALTEYENALAMRPDQDYPQERVDLIRKMLGIQAERESLSKEKKENYQSPNEEFKNAIAQKYPDGVTEEIKTSGNKTITMRYVVKANRGDAYKMIKHNWGGKFFFKNEQQITELIWEKETED